MLLFYIDVNSCNDFKSTKQKSSSRQLVTARESKLRRKLCITTILIRQTLKTDKLLSGRSSIEILIVQYIQ